jgi:hypothetical protein
MKMALVAIAATAVLAATTSAMAASRHHHHRAHTQVYVYPNGPVGSAYGYYGRSDNYYGRPGDPYGVYDGSGRFIGRDPDPNVRQQLYREYYKFGPGSPI